METNFFQQLYELAPNTEFLFAINITEDGKYKVMLHPQNRNIKDEAAKLIIPMVINPSTPAELDTSFFDKIASRLKTTNEVFFNMLQYDKQLAEASKQSKAAQDAASKLSKEDLAQQKKFDAIMKQVDELAGKEKYGEAMGKLPKAEDFPKHADQIKARYDELKSKRTALQEPELFSNDQI